MKKIIMLSALTISLLTCGCSNLVPDKSTAKDLIHEKEVVAPQVEKSEECKTVISQTEFDIDRDGKDDMVSLLTSAETDDGEILWDDSNKWCVYVDIGGKTYELLNKSVSTGKVSYNLYQNKNGKNIIAVTEETGASLKITEYTFDGEGFSQKVAFLQEDVNMIGSSFEYTNVNE